MPVAVMWAVDGNYRQSGRMDAQINTSIPLKKRIWQQIVQAKISNQAMVLESKCIDSRLLVALAKGVRSGDTDNSEAQAAKIYWKLLFGGEFVRNHDEEDVCNSCLNYGYAILRSATARAIMASGLHPSLGVFHKNQNNPMRLVDDLMEPLRPLVDDCVHDIMLDGCERLDKGVKERLGRLMYADIAGQGCNTPVVIWLENMAVNLAHVYEGVKNKLELPLICGTNT